MTDDATNKADNMEYRLRELQTAIEENTKAVTELRDDIISLRKAIKLKDETGN
jgi:hypothetical protein